MSFENLIGNPKNKELLETAIKNNNLVHSYLFVGEEGIGKDLFAKQFAQMILCEHPEGQVPCGRCKSCMEFLGGSHPDFMIVEPEDGKTIKIEQVRFLQEKIAEKPVTSKKKVYILSQSETMTREAANSLLKTLEQPPEYAVIILTTSNESKLLTTIKSRCMKIYFLPISEAEILQYVKVHGLENNITENMIKQCSGSIGKLLKMSEEKEQYFQVENLIENIKNTDITQIWKQADVLYNAKENIIDLLEYMTIVFFEQLKRTNQICYSNRNYNNRANKEKNFSKYELRYVN